MGSVHAQRETHVNVRRVHEKSAVDREAVDATWPVDRSENGDLRVCTVICMSRRLWSQDVEKCTLDLVLSYSTHTNTVRTMAVASKGRRFFPSHPLMVACQTVCVSINIYYKRNLNTHMIRIRYA